MTYKTPTIQQWAHSTAKYMEANGYTERDKPITVAEIAERVGFHPCQWSRVKDQLYSLGYHLAQRYGRGGGFYLGEPGEEATAVAGDQKQILTRLKTLQRRHKQVSGQPHYGRIVAYAQERLEHNLLAFAGSIGSHAPQLALPAPDMVRKSREAA